ncbi:MAG TPA: PQQ-binding-like beta-propeller repeat protein [Polyangiales bacterium]
MSKRQSARAEPAEVVREYGPFQPGERVHGVTHDGERVWFATGERLRALDPDTGELSGELTLAADAGTAYDGKHLYQLADGHIQKVDPASGRVLARLPIPGEGGGAGLTWAEGKLWLAKHTARKILQIDPETGAVLRTLESNRFVTGVTWADGQLWHATLEDGVSELRGLDPESGEVLERLIMPEGAKVSGLERHGELFFCGGADSGKIRAVKRVRSAR